VMCVSYAFQFFGVRRLIHVMFYSFVGVSYMRKVHCEKYLHFDAFVVVLKRIYE
jgi:hypothetical protein